jgi:hypothetical protein
VDLSSELNFLRKSGPKDPGAPKTRKKRDEKADKEKQTQGFSQQARRSCRTTSFCHTSPLVKVPGKGQKEKPKVIRPEKAGGRDGKSQKRPRKAKGKEPKKAKERETKVSRAKPHYILIRRSGKGKSREAL